MSTSRTATRARAALSLVFLSLQVAVPTALLFGPRPARFGWQMFSAHTTAPVFAVEHADGSRALVDVDDYFAFRRGDLDPAVFDRLPAHLCRIDATVVTVYERRPGETTIEAHPCR